LYRSLNCFQQLSTWHLNNQINTKSWIYQSHQWVWFWKQAIRHAVNQGMTLNDYNWSRACSQMKNNFKWMIKHNKNESMFIFQFPAPVRYTTGENFTIMIETNADLNLIFWILVSCLTIWRVILILYEHFIKWTFIVCDVMSHRFVGDKTKAEARRSLLITQDSIRQTKLQYHFYEVKKPNIFRGDVTYSHVCLESPTVIN